MFTDVRTMCNKCKKNKIKQSFVRCFAKQYTQSALMWCDLQPPLLSRIGINR